MNISQLLKEEAALLGFDNCGIAKATELTEDAHRLETWLSKGYNGGMGYMAKNFDLRIDPRRLFPGAKSVVTLMYNYFPEKQQVSGDAKVSKYAYGADYHEIIRPKLNALLAFMQQQVGDVAGRGFVDSAPVLERSWAQRSGLGWVGKNGNLISKQQGSFFFLATLVVDIELEYDAAFATDHCGTCTRCLDACPTNAIVSPTVIDGSRCISYLTIELKDELIPQEFAGKMENWLFGCDICQDVCPWNRFSKAHENIELKPLEAVISFDLNDWLQLEQETFSTLLRHSPLKRSKWKGIKRNAEFLSINK